MQKAAKIFIVSKGSQKRLQIYDNKSALQSHMSDNSPKLPILSRVRFCDFHLEVKYIYIKKISQKKFDQFYKSR